ncbi:hypothetical protein N7457_001588 [Penicillium paradoxum]|uniref:uncharacterized protein n=1 Tax=Penicillium paradoxum TaxID=176176 RepID=UPI0025492E90|nr:uncharacterized protein N7457_001588 [Penicillium paradoxum]KAJ5794989.1 hypothetical protein N7457_001588 [Penicillium paradoxum]
MYDPATSLSLHRLSRHSLQDRYESDEEAVSESDAGAQDLLSSPVHSKEAEIFDTDLSAGDTLRMGHDSDRNENTILAPTIKRSRPVSSATKRNSRASFDEDSYVFDPEEQVVLELPSPEPSPQMASPTFLQPSMYVWPKPPRPTNSRSRSASPASLFSVEDADIQIAKSVTMMEPPTRPTVVLINALGSRTKGSKSRPSNSHSRESSRNRPALAKAANRFAMLRSPEKAIRPSRIVEKPNTSKQSPNTTPTLASGQGPLLGPSAVINHVSEIPPVPSLPAPPRTAPTQEYRGHLHTPASDAAMPPPLKLRTRRPPSLHSTSSGSVRSQPSRPTTPFSSEEMTSPLGTTKYDIPAQLTRTDSPVSISSTSSPPPYTPSKRSAPPSYSVSNMLTGRSPIMMRGTTRKHSSSSIHSLNSLRSEVGANEPTSSQISVATQPVPAPSPEPQRLQKSNQSRHIRNNSTAPSGRGFMGLKFGRRAPTKP